MYRQRSIQEDGVYDREGKSNVDFDYPKRVRKIDARADELLAHESLIAVAAA